MLFLTLGTYFASRWEQRYGDVFSVHVAPAGQAVVLSRPEHIREVFAGPADTFHAGEGNAILGPIMGEHSVLLLDEDAHKASRKRVMSAFRGETIAGWGAVLEELAADSIATWPVGDAVRAAPAHERHQPRGHPAHRLRRHRRRAARRSCDRGCNGWSASARRSSSVGCTRGCRPSARGAASSS